MCMVWVRGKRMTGERIEWQPPVLPPEIPQGDMPGDHVAIAPGAEARAARLFPYLLELANDPLRRGERLVVAVSGGSGVGKTSIASVLAYYFRDLGIGAYTLSGDNYPRRLPKYNDAERLHRFQEAGLRAMIREGCCSDEARRQLRELQRAGLDADLETAERFPWLRAYLRGGLAALEAYLGTSEEIEYDLLNDVLQRFRAGAPYLWLKRMGRDDGEIWFERTDLRAVRVLLLEWTHGGSEELRGVDIPIYLDSTPEETAALRRNRGRDAGTDTPLVARVLEIEQRKLRRRAENARIILPMAGEIRLRKGE